MATGLLAVAFDSTGVAEDEFNDWYDTEHIPERRRLSGFLALQRWIGVDDHRLAVATYDLQSLQVLEGAAYRAISGENLSPWSKRITGKCRRIMRFEGEQLTGESAAPADAAALLLVAMNVDPEWEQEFNRWYNEEHLPSLSALPGVLCARRFRANTGPVKYLASYHLGSADVCESPAWKKAVDTNWTRRMHAHVGDRLRIVARAYRRKG